ncbi:MAG: D-alanyl-D-alanine carboxypeptidase/D-alanyl-D-alanine-endopeptidase [Thermoleophilaceae bacterium]|jgi:D-alanyl-D-alanine carboxypeptidase/D-alanyl-D-alanine-endopeptidase (penicillin-binding protein 4)|nr:D-alanyl-D-alanine carboxypeptidase/D-alanyl-D-alanine-endopeptidase [Thermoleophilaceae bacterium]
MGATSRERLFRTLGLAILGLCLVPGPAAAQDALRSTLDRAMRQAGPSSGAYVAEGRRPLYARRAGTPRVLASNAKLFTTAAALGRLGPDATFETRVLSAGAPSGGVVSGNLYVRGGGDPAFGSAAFVRRAYGSGAASVETLAAQVRAAGVTRVTGAVVGDEALFDSRRGGPASGYRPSIYVGPLSALPFNRGLANPSGRAFQSNPPAFTAGVLDRALEQAGVSVAGRPRAGRAPGGAVEVTKVSSPGLGRLAALTNKPSDNFFAEILLKGLGARSGGGGTTAAGARQATVFARQRGASARLVDGSGLSRGNRASPQAVVRLLEGVRSTPSFPSFFESLAVAGRDGTLRRRMTGGAARGNCRGKTGTLAGVSTLSGYCRTRGGRNVSFSFLMNGVSPPAARRLQDRMTETLARGG